MMFELQRSELCPRFIDEVSFLPVVILQGGRPVVTQWHSLIAVAGKDPEPHLFGSPRDVCLNCVPFQPVVVEATPIFVGIQAVEDLGDSGNGVFLADVA